MSAVKQYMLVAVIVLLVGTTYFINSNSIKRAGSDQAVTIIPRVTSESNTAASSPTAPPTEVKKDATPGKYLSAEVK